MTHCMLKIMYHDIINNVWWYVPLYEAYFVTFQFRLNFNILKLYVELKYRIVSKIYYSVFRWPRQPQKLEGDVRRHCWTWYIHWSFTCVALIAFFRTFQWWFSAKNNDRSNHTFSLFYHYIILKNQFLQVEYLENLSLYTNVEA